MSIFEQLKKRGDWILVEGKTRAQVASAAGHFFARQMTRDVIVRCFDVHDGVIVFMAYMPEGAVEAFEKHRLKVKMDRQERMEEHNPGTNYASIIAEEESKQKERARLKQEFEDAEDPWEQYDGNDEDD